jgi:hypothetical protein
MGSGIVLLAVGVLLLLIIAAIGWALGKLFALAEAYPDLKANQNFRELQGELANTGDERQDVSVRL